MASGAGEIYGATYSNVPVYELKVAGDHVMRRRSDDWINATHILKIAGFDKPARTRILEREVQRGVHEKIQGGYGKYQGTWVPLGEGRALADKHNILERIGKIFDYVPGDKSPPLAPKHTTAASGRSKPTKAVSQPARRTVANGKPSAARPQRQVTQSGYYPASEVQYEEESTHYAEDEEAGHQTPSAASFLDVEDFVPLSQISNASRKRKRDAEEAAFSAAEVEHTLYGDELLDYFVTAGDNDGTSNIPPPVPPSSFDVNRPIDTHGNNALHWACAMGDVQVTKDLLQRGANPRAENAVSGETPLMRAVLFTNNFDKQTFPKIVNMLAGTIVDRDRHGATVFHHIAETARSRSKWSCARYYCEILINKMLEMGYNFVQTLLVSVDRNGDTAVLCAIRNACIKVASFLLNHCPEAGDIPNHNGETANDILRYLREKRESLEQPPSSPPRADESFTSASRKRSTGRSSHKKRNTRQPLSRAAENVLSRVGPIMEEASTKLASMYDGEMKDKDTSITEAKVALSDFENQRHRIRQETFALMARAEAEGFADTNNENIDTTNTNSLIPLRNDFGGILYEVESYLEKKDHGNLQSTVMSQDQQTPPQAFRSANNNNQPLTHDETRSSAAWFLELNHQQSQRRGLVNKIAKLTGSAGTGEKVGKHRKLVAVATGLKEDQLDMMSDELLQSLEATKEDPLLNVVSAKNVGAGTGGEPRTPPRVVHIN